MTPAMYFAGIMPESNIQKTAQTCVYIGFENNQSPMMIQLTAI